MTCERCGGFMLVDRDVDGSTEYVCVSGHRPITRNPELLASLTLEMQRHTNGQQSGPRHAGMDMR